MGHAQIIQRVISLRFVIRFLSIVSHYLLPFSDVSTNRFLFFVDVIEFYSLERLQHMNSCAFKVLAFKLFIRNVFMLWIEIT